MPLNISLEDRSFDLVLLSNWEDQIIYEPDTTAPHTHLTEKALQKNLTTPVNKALESGAWTQSIIWSPNAPFLDFTQLELPEEDLAPEERAPGALNMVITPYPTSQFIVPSARGRTSQETSAARQRRQGQVQYLKRPVLRSLKRRWPASCQTNVWAAGR